MHDVIKSSWLSMSAGRLQTMLYKRGYPFPIIRDLLKQVHDMKEARRKRRIRETHHGKLWAQLLEPARMELQRIRTMRCSLAKLAEAEPTNPNHTAKLSAVTVYEAAIVSVVQKLRQIQREDECTPTQFVAMLKKDFGKTIPNGGTHWVDYVPRKTVEHVTTLFDALPSPQRGKRKVPFERLIPLEAHLSALSKLNDRLKQDLAALEREMDVTQDDDTLDKLNAKRMEMLEAQYILDSVPVGTPLPATWHSAHALRDYVKEGHQNSRGTACPTNR